MNHDDDDDDPYYHQSTSSSEVAEPSTSSAAYPEVYSQKMIPGTGGPTIPGAANVRRNFERKIRTKILKKKQIKSV